MVRFQDSDDAFQAIGQSRGQALRFTDIDGVGPATAQKIKNADYSIQAPKDIQDMSADELADKAGISYNRAEKAIRGAGGNPNVSKRDNTGTVSASGITQRVGDFRVSYSDIDKARARNDPQSRSKEAVQQDERKRAPVTTNYDKWKNNPGRYDFPGVDTPTQEPYLREKDVKQRERPQTADFEARDQQDQERQQESYPRKRDSASGKSNFILETGDERIPASEVTRQVPEGTDMPGFAPSDFETEPETPGRDKTMGRMPSSQRAPKSLIDSFASGEEADFAFLGAERERSQPNEQQRQDHYVRAFRPYDD